MHSLIVLAALPLCAGAPANLKIAQASVVWGAGIEPKGGMPPGRFEARVTLAGRKVPTRPVFRVWRVKIGDFPGLDNRDTKFPTLGKSHRLDATVTKGVTGTWTLNGTWLGAPETEDRLVVEARSASRRIGWAVSALEEHALQSIEKRPARINRE